MRIISQRYIGDGQFMLQLGGLSSETKPTDDFVATGSQFFEDDTDAVFTFSGLTWNLEKNGQMKDLPVVTATDNGKVLKVKDGVWSVGEDGGGEGGGGAEKFVVTLTQENDTWTADKTVAEIVAAYEANKIVVAKIPYNELFVDIPCLVAGVIDNNGIAAFTGNLIGDTYDAPVAYINGYESDGSDEWQVSINDVSVSIPNGSNDGDLLVWDNDHDKWKAESNPNAPLIVTMTEDQQNPGTYVGDKTFGEIKTAMDAGRTAMVKVGSAGTSPIVVVTAIDNDGTLEYTIGFALFEGEITGTANEYPSFISTNQP